MNNDNTHQEQQSPVVTFSNIPLDDEPVSPGFDTLPPEATQTPMVTVADIQFKKGGKVYYFDPGSLSLTAGDEVIIDTARGPEYGFCSGGNHDIPRSQVIPPLRQVIRIATDRDKQVRQEYKKKEFEALAVCQQKIAEHKLDMKLVSAEYSFDGSKILFYFTADGRVDFRDLVKDLAAIFRTRIELRQIGVRDEAKLLGGIGPCGRPICCRTFLSELSPVTIKMAKEQNLSLNPTKISGLCDKLMCCLKYEQDHYEATRKRMPRTGKSIMTPDGLGTVSAINALSETVRVRIAVGDSFELREYPIDACSRVSQEQAAQPAARAEEEEAPAAPEQEKTEKQEKHREAPREQNAKEPRPEKRAPQGPRPKERKDDR